MYRAQSASELTFAVKGGVVEVSNNTVILLAE